MPNQLLTPMQEMLAQIENIQNYADSSRIKYPSVVSEEPYDAIRDVMPYAEDGDFFGILLLQEHTISFATKKLPLARLAMRLVIPNTGLIEYREETFDEDSQSIPTCASKIGLSVLKHANARLMLSATENELLYQGIRGWQDNSSPARLYRRMASSDSYASILQWAFDQRNSRDSYGAV